jgi:hypothetical protein
VVWNYGEGCFSEVDLEEVDNVVTRIVDVIAWIRFAEEKRTCSEKENPIYFERRHYFKS